MESLREECHQRVSTLERKVTSLHFSKSCLILRLPLSEIPYESIGRKSDHVLFITRNDYIGTLYKEFNIYI